MIWETLATGAIIFCLLIGGSFSLIASIGLLKFSDAMARLHAPTKVGTLGIGAFLVAAMIHSFMIGEGALHEALILAFLFLTAPISANFISKVNIHLRDCATLPPGDEWAALDTAEAEPDLSEQTES